MLVTCGLCSGEAAALQKTKTKRKLHTDRLRRLDWTSRKFLPAGERGNVASYAVHLQYNVPGAALLRAKNLERSCKKVKLSRLSTHLQ